jgi:CubicO group peptidase (beta-lactamase class C family)
MKRIIVLITIILYAGFISAQENKLPAFITDSLDAYIHRGMTRWQIPGLSIAIVKDRKVIYMKGFGVTRVGTSEPIDENTLFMIGSNTKAFTSTAIAILQEEGKLSLDDKVQKWMPEFKLKDPLATSEVTIADLLCHRIGFETFQGDFTYWGSALTRAEVIQKMSLIDAPYGFRTKYGYCNAAFMTAGELIPRITGKSWEETVKEKILVPLKMNQTLLLSADFKTVSHKAFPHSMVEGKLIEIPINIIDNLAPAGSISSSVKDMVQWLITQLGNGELEGQQVIPDGAVQTIRKPYTIIGVNPRNNQFTHFALYGLGLRINDRNGKLVYSHGGAVEGFLSSLVFIPEENLGIIVLTNNDVNNFYQDLTSEIRDAFLDLPYKGYSDNSITYFLKEMKVSNARIDSLRNVVKLKNNPSHALKAYTGTYMNEVYGKITIAMEDKLLTVHFSHHPDLTARLEHLTNDTFLCSFSNPLYGIQEIPFMTANGKVAGLTLHVTPSLEFTPYVFTKKK